MRWDEENHHPSSTICEVYAFWRSDSSDFFIIPNLLIDFLLESIQLFIQLPIIIPAMMAMPILIMAIPIIGPLFMLQHI